MFPQDGAGEGEGSPATAGSSSSSCWPGSDTPPLPMGFHSQSEPADHKQMFSVCVYMCVRRAAFILSSLTAQLIWLDLNN